MRSSTVKVHMKTHGEEAVSPKKTPKVSKPKEPKTAYEEEKKFPVISEPIKVIKVQPTPVKPEVLVKPEIPRTNKSSFKTPPYQKLNTSLLSAERGKFGGKPMDMRTYELEINLYSCRSKPCQIFICNLLQLIFEN